VSPDEFDRIQDFVVQRRLALVGVSRSGTGFGHLIRQTLRRQGYSLQLVHHELAEVAGHPCVCSIAELEPPVDGIILCTPPKVSEGLIDALVAAKIPRVWLQQGAQSLAAVERAEAAGLSVVAGRCILMFAQPKGIHRFHRWLLELFGRVPKRKALVP
jgi:predicted CoA-binding protein